MLGPLIRGLGRLGASTMRRAGPFVSSHAAQERTLAEFERKRALFERAFDREEFGILRSFLGTRIQTEAMLRAVGYDGAELRAQYPMPSRNPADPHRTVEGIPPGGRAFFTAKRPMTPLPRKRT